jgi:PAS domain S-box-containing protein
VSGRAEAQSGERQSNHAEELTVDGEARARRIDLALEAAGAGIVSHHLPTGEMLADERAAGILGHPHESLPTSAEGWWELAHPDDIERCRGSLDAHLRGETSGYYCQVRMRDAQGRYRWISIRGRIVERDGTGEPTRVDGIVIDIDEEERHAAATDTHGQIIRGLTQGYWHVDRDGRTVAANPAMTEMLGVAEDALRGRPFWEYVAPELRDQTEELWSRRSAGAAERHPSVLVHASGHRAEVEMSALPLFDAAGDFDGAVALVTDVTERNAAERELRDRERALEQLVEQIPYPMQVLDTDGTAVMVNQAFLTTFGIDSAEHVIGKYNAHADPLIDQVGLREDVLRAFAGEVPPCREFTLELSEPARKFGVKRDGNLYMEITLFPVLDESSQVRQVVTIWRDLTAEKRAREEQRLAERQAERSQRLESLGVLAGGVAHDFNNILAAILGYAEITAERLSNDGPAKANLEEIMNAAERAGQLTRQILDFTRKGDEERRELKLQPILKETVRLLSATLRAAVEIRERIDPHVGPVLGDASRLHQVVLNLCTNARQAIVGPHGTIEVGLDEWTSGDTLEQGRPPLPPGRYAHIWVSDSGCGMSAEVLESIFEPFYTTKHASQGSGMGLAMAQGIVQMHEGLITVDSTVGVGSIFHVYLPIHEPGQSHGAGRREGQVPEGDGQHILMVDDDETILSALQPILSLLGYRVTARSDPEEALADFSAYPREFDLVLTDQLMPGMLGSELAAKIHEARPELPVILLTGYARELTVDELATSCIRALLQKPIAKSDLARAVADALSRA